VGVPDGVEAGGDESEPATAGATLALANDALVALGEGWGWLGGACVIGAEAPVAAGLTSAAG
jgi:hypothetical protein